MKNPLKILLAWWHRLGMREQFAAAVISALALIVVAVIDGWFKLSAARVTTASVLPIPNNQTQSGSGNFQAGRDVIYQDNRIYSFYYFGTQANEQGSHTISESDAFKTLADSLRRSVKSNLANVQRKFSGVPIKVVIASQAGNSERMKLADELAEIFREAGIDANTRSSYIFTEERAPIIFNVHPKSRDWAIAIGKSFEPMIRTQIPIPLMGKETRPPEELHISLLGKPVFDIDGVAVFK